MKTKNEPNVNRKQTAALSEEELGKVSGAGQFDLKDLPEGLPGYEVKWPEDPQGRTDEPSPLNVGEYTAKITIDESEKYKDIG